MIDLGKGGYSGTSAGMAYPLLDSHCGREAGNSVHIGPLQDSHILSNIRRQTFQITALSLRKEDIKGKR